MPVRLFGQTINALLGSGCGDNFVSEEVADAFDLPRYKLTREIPMQQVDGTSFRVTEYVRPVLRIRDFRVRLAMKIIRSSLMMVLGYPFLRYLRVEADWAAR